jgi:glycerophosphoryl diester phosphodiesterase
MARYALILLGVLLGLGRAQAQTPLPNAHSHNDYAQKRPLLDALEQGFCSVEADVYAVDGKLLVAHHRNFSSPDRTLQALYLEPLKEQVRKNRGSVYPQKMPFTLLIEFKSSAEETYPLLQAALKPYRAMLTEFRERDKRERAITVLITGNAPREQAKKERRRLFAIEGGLSDIGSEVPLLLVPQVSTRWTETFRWSGFGEFPEEERTRLMALMAQAQRDGRKVRFWGGFDTPTLWKVQREAGVDWLNVDSLARLRAFLAPVAMP